MKIHKIKSRIKSLYLKSSNWLLEKISLRPRTQKGVEVSLLCFVLLIFGYYGFENLHSQWGRLVDLIMGMLLGLLMVGLGSILMRLILRLAGRLPIRLTAYIIAAFLTLLLPMWHPAKDGILPVAFVVLMASLIGGSIAVLLSKNFTSISWQRKTLTLSLLLISIGGTGWLLWWIVQPGTTEKLITIPQQQTQFITIDSLDAPNPSLTGEYNVEFLTYGSGTDRRPEFGQKVTLKTRSVNAKPFVDSLSGKLCFLRKDFWGFNRENMPLNARVWYPQGDGPFPLVLIVHGNHLMREYSDEGYEYLAQLLASRGYIFVSVDENFLNGDWSDSYNGENDARGWIMLEHLKIWREWSSDSTNLFFNKVDMNNIALMGHSRGGEAVSIASAFNILDRYPDDARVKFDYHFNIRSVVAIAPIDGQYYPSNSSTPMENTNYLLLQGSHDSDVSFFSGDRQYKRIKFTDKLSHFKTSLYIYRANHGQFNTVWGNRDHPIPAGYLLNTKPLISGQEQRQIAKVYISAFLDATLKNRASYRPMFQDYRRAKQWLPKTYYINRFQSNNAQYICDFDEDIDVTTTTLKGGSIQGNNLANWQEKDMGFRKGYNRRQNQVVLLGWKYNDSDSTNTNDSLIKSHSVNPYQELTTDSSSQFIPATYTIYLPKVKTLKCTTDQSSILTFSLAQVDQKPSDPLNLKPISENSSLNNNNNDDKNKDGDSEFDNSNANSSSHAKDSISKELKNKPIDFTLEIEDTLGQRASITLQRVITIMPPLKAQFTRYKTVEKHFGSSSEPVLQTVNIPMREFQSINKHLNTRHIKAIRMIFDRSKKGVIMIDEIGFTNQK